MTEANHACVALATGDSPEKYATVRNVRMKLEEIEQEALAACKTNSANCTNHLSSACEKIILKKERSIEKNLTFAFVSFLLPLMLTNVKSLIPN